MGTRAVPKKDMATGDMRSEQAIQSAEEAIRTAEAAVSQVEVADEKVTIDELLELLDPTKVKTVAHLVFIKAEYTPVVPIVSEHVRETVDRVGYFRLAKAMLDVQTDENGQAVARDIVATLEAELEIDREDAVAVVLALADSKSVAKRAQTFAQQRMERFSQMVSSSRDKVVAQVAEAKVKVDEKMAEAKLKVSLRAEEASNKLQQLVADDSTVRHLCCHSMYRCRTSGLCRV